MKQVDAPGYPDSKFIRGAGLQWLMPIILATQKAQIRRTLGVAEVVVHLPSKGDAQSSNPSATKKRKYKNKTHRNGA
jgi:hypothetical protein